MGDSLSTSLKPKRVRVTLPRGPGRLVTKTGLAAVLKQLAEGMGIRLEVDGAAWATQTGDGMALRIQPGGETVDHPWKGKYVSGTFSVLGGFVNSIEVPLTAVSGSSGFAFFKLTFALDVSDAFVHGGSLTDADLMFSSSVPSDDGAVGEFHLVLFEYSGGAVVSQSATRHIQVRVCDDGTGTATGYLDIIQS